MIPADHSRDAFEALTPDEKHEAVVKMAMQGHSAYTISAATGIAVEQIREMVPEARE